MENKSKYINMENKSKIHTVIVNVHDEKYLLSFGIHEGTYLHLIMTNKRSGITFEKKFDELAILGMTQHAGLVSCSADIIDYLIDATTLCPINNTGTYVDCSIVPTLPNNEPEMEICLMIRANIGKFKKEYKYIFSLEKNMQTDLELVDFMLKNFYRDIDIFLETHVKSIEKINSQVELHDKSMSLLTSNETFNILAKKVDELTCTLINCNKKIAELEQKILK